MLAPKRLKFFYWVLTLALPGAAGADEFSFKLNAKPTQSQCKIFKFQNHSWVPAAPEFLNSTDTFVGDLMPGHPEYISFKKDQTRFTVLTECARKEGAASRLPDAPAPKTSSFYAFISYLSWQESLSLTGPAGAVYNLNSTETGVCVGGNWRKKVSMALEYDVSGCGVFTTSDLGSPSNSAALPVSYHVTSAHVWGIGAEFGLGFRPGGGRVTIGPRLGLFYRSGNWTQPTSGSGYSLTSTSGLYPVFLIDSRFDLRHFYLQPAVGFFSALSNFIWSLGVGYEI